MGAPLRRRPKAPYRNDALASALLAKLVGKQRTLWGVPLTFIPAAGDVPAKWYVDHPQWRQTHFPTARKAVIAFLERSRGRTFAKHWVLRRTKWHWVLRNTRDAKQATCFLERPTRKHIADAIRQFRQLDSSPSHARPSTLGWRAWTWDRKQKCLKSPHTGTLWPDISLTMAEGWDRDGVVRGVAGIHACRLPRGDWKMADRPHDMPGGIILGVLERFGKYALGTEGWRAEMVVIKELLAPNAAVAETLRKVYPEVKIYVAHPTHWIHTFATAGA